MSIKTIFCKIGFSVALLTSIVFTLFVFKKYEFPSLLITNLNLFNRGINKSYTTTSSIFEDPLEIEFRLLNNFDNITENGKPFNTSWNIHLRNLNLLEIKDIDDQEILESEPIIGTACSSNHYGELLNLMESLINVYHKPVKKMIYVYDLGLRLQQRENLISTYGDIIREVRNFSFETYPSYFKNLKQFRWKPIVVAELLKEFPSMWWMDSSVQIKRSLTIFYSDIRRCRSNIANCQYYPWSLIKNPGHSIYATTDKRMYKYLPIPEIKAKELTEFEANLQLIFATNAARKNVLRYWVLCALEEDCMDPPNTSLYCKFKKNAYIEYAGCHRQDQSAINILLALTNSFNGTRYQRDFDGTLVIARG